MLCSSNKKPFLKIMLRSCFPHSMRVWFFLRPRRPFLGPRRGENCPFSLSRFATVIEVFVVWLGRCFVRVLGNLGRKGVICHDFFPVLSLFIFPVWEEKSCFAQNLCGQRPFPPVSENNKKDFRGYGNMWNYGRQKKGFPPETSFLRSPHISETFFPKKISRWDDGYTWIGVTPDTPADFYFRQLKGKRRGLFKTE